LALIRDNLGRNTVRVGITQYPAGLGIMEAGELKPDLVDACETIRMGTALFAKVYRIVIKWYGNPTAKDVLPQVFDDGIIAWQTGYFEGTAVFRASDPAELKRTQQSGHDHVWPVSVKSSFEESGDAKPNTPDLQPSTEPNKAGIRVDLSRIGGSG
jgi:hypothetical protein